MRIGPTIVLHSEICRLIPLTVLLLLGRIPSPRPREDISTMHVTICLLASPTYRWRFDGPNKFLVKDFAWDGNYWSFPCLTTQDQSCFNYHSSEGK